MEYIQECRAIRVATTQREEYEKLMIRAIQCLVLSVLAEE
jgi:hypothetical protein